MKVIILKVAGGIVSRFGAVLSGALLSAGMPETAAAQVETGLTVLCLFLADAIVSAVLKPKGV